MIIWREYVLLSWWNGYREYEARLQRYAERIWTCKSTGSNQLTHKEAWEEEQEVTELWVTSKSSLSDITTEMLCFKININCYSIQRLKRSVAHTAHCLPLKVTRFTAVLLDFPRAPPSFLFASRMDWVILESNDGENVFILFNEKSAK
jgi:hypothetical protein